MKRDRAEPTQESRTFGRWPRRRYWLIVYVGLLMLSHLVQWSSDRGESPAQDQTNQRLARDPTFVETTTTTIPAMGKDGPVGDRTIELGSIEWAPDTPDDRPWVILLHGSPGDAMNLRRLGAELAERGHAVLSVNLPGFGTSTAYVPSYSVRAAAHSVLALMDARGIDRAHVAGWSNGGAVVINMADIAPDRVATITLIAGTGAQSTEGSGDYYFEHAKYALGYAAVVVLPELLPHFGMLGDFHWRNTFIRSFWDSDQRPLAGIMQRLTTPALILQGRHDFLVADWAAEEHHRLIPTSRLVMLDANHFLPTSQLDQTASYMVELFRRHDVVGVEARTDAIILEPRRPGMFGRVGARLARVPREHPWWVAAAGIAMMAFVLPYTAIATGGLAVALMQLDIGVALVGLVAGRVFRSRTGCSRSGRSRSGLSRSGQLWTRWLMLIIGTLVLLFLASLIAPKFALSGSDRFGITGAVVGVALTAVVICVLSIIVLGVATTIGMLCTWRGRHLLFARVIRTIRREYWPIWAIYLPILPHLLRLAIRHRGPLLFTACNPGIGNGGGLVGESKHDIMQGLRHAGERALNTVLIDCRGKPDARAHNAIKHIRADVNLGGYPVVLKPDAGERGLGVSIVRSDEDVRAYFKTARQAIVLQRYHAGPCECGVLWCRDTKQIGRDGRDGVEGSVDGADRQRTGTILAITRKTFAEVQGDGKRTIERLIYAQPRFAPHAHAMLSTLDDDPTRVPGAGERIVIGEIGCHSGGALFRDGADLITPELERAIDEISRSFPSFRDEDEDEDGDGDGGGGLDVGRYDLRYQSEEALRRGEGFGIVELNGVTGESTNIYDPDKSLAWAIGVMKVHWTRMYELGAQRRASGHKPLSVFKTLRLLVLSGRRRQ